MAAFRFRAAAALDLRREQEQAALEALGRAEARFHEVAVASEAEQARRERARADLVALGQRGSDVDTILWHRNWIHRLTNNVDRLRQEVDECAALTGRARSVWYEARRKRLALERMKDRAWRRHQQMELREEMKALNELARIRFVMSEPLEE